jgi:hypothetical protein
VSLPIARARWEEGKRKARHSSASPLSLRHRQQSVVQRWWTQPSCGYACVGVLTFSPHWCAIFLIPFKFDISFSIAYSVFISLSTFVIASRGSCIAHYGRGRVA